VLADLGCGWGHFSFALADLVGSEGKVFSVDLTPKVIAKIQQKAIRTDQHNIEAHASSAADVSFIKDKSIDLFFANGLLCSMAVDRPSAIAEIKRILKSSGHAYLSLGAIPPLGYVDEKEWHAILQGFRIDAGGSYRQKWAVVSLARNVDLV
jgi:ubiquinone/menaquinone biosynthesis C-methylase UbiE